MRKLNLSIRQILVVITSALTLMIAYLASKDMYVNWVGLTKIETLYDAWSDKRQDLRRDRKTLC